MEDISKEEYQDKMELEKVHAVYKVYPFINNLVDFLYTDELNTLIQNNIKSDLDKRSFMMYIIMYFYTYLNVSHKTSKEDIKYFLTDIIQNPDKRQKCIELYMNFENISIKQ
jgi:hypothetical protein